MLNDPVFKPGDIVKCLNPGGYYMLREGELYEVAKYEPKAPTPTFTWPAYVHVKDNLGKMCICHAHRFQHINNQG